MMFIRNILLTIAVAVVVGACVTTAPELPEEPGVSNLAQAKAQGSFTLPSSYVRRQQYSCNDTFYDPEWGRADTCVVVRKQRPGELEAGKYFVGVYLNGSGSGANRVRAALFTQSKVPFVVSYPEARRHLLIFCDGDSCTVQRYFSSTKTVAWPNVVAAAHVLNGGKALVVAHKAPGDACEVAVADATTNLETTDYWSAVARRFEIADGQEAEIPEAGTVRCSLRQQGAGIGVGLEFLRYERRS